MAGVGITPAVVIAAPSECTPRASSRSIHSPDSRVSRPIDEPQRRRLRLAVARRAGERIARTSAAPSRATVS